MTHLPQPVMQACSRRGVALVVALWVVVTLTGLVLSLSFTMRTEAIAAANRVSLAQAEAAERGMEQLLLSLVDAQTSAPGSLQEVSLEGRLIGDCVAWVIRPDAMQDDQLAYGLSDEAAKLDLNTASADMLLRLPGMTQEVVDAIVDWRDADSTPAGLGAEDDYYLSLPEAYHCKNGPFETVEELLLVKGMTPELLYGYDRNRNGILDGQEMQASSSVAFGAATGEGRGIAPFVTVYGVRASRAVSTEQLADVNARDTAALRAALRQYLSSSRADEIATRVRTLQPFSSVFDFHYRMGLTEDELGAIFTHIQAVPSSPTSQPATAAATAKLNVNAAPLAVLLTLPGLDENDASAIISTRPVLNDEPQNLAWLVSALPREKVLAIANLVGGASVIYSGEIVALSADGRGYRRVRVVISAETTPARIIARSDVSAQGWPLDAETRASVRAGIPYVAPIQVISQGG